MTKYRPHRGSLVNSMAEVIEVRSIAELVHHLQRTCIPDRRSPTRETVEVAPYCFDGRIGWNTYLVTVDGAPWGFTDGPLK